MMLVGSPLGVVIGYAITSMMIHRGNEWILPFQVYAFVNWGIAAAFVFVHRSYLNINEVFEAKKVFIK